MAFVEAGARQGHFSRRPVLELMYTLNRILAGDAFYMKITDWQKGSGSWHSWPNTAFVDGRVLLLWAAVDPATSRSTS
ncbi:hypothetical protein ACFY30_17045 [Streptomyces sp. NPDC000345]|uniref:hypothetical protein n=1 Tax=Streptomyces sp. NPDC000345 TaxID=3364537 RepID=UPI0036A5DB69